VRAHPQEHPFPTCFVCGPDRRPGDGLRILVGPVAGRDLSANVWYPDEALAESQMALSGLSSCGQRLTAPEVWVPMETPPWKARRTC